MIQNISFGCLINNNYRQLPLSGRGLEPLPKDTVSFKGLSLPSQYKTSFDYLAAEILKSNKKWRVDGSLLSATNVAKAMTTLFAMNRVFGPYQESRPDKIKWKKYIPQEIRTYCTDKINDARAARLKQWQDFLENPVLTKEESEKLPNLVNDIKESLSLKFVIWQAINSELKANNRHIPVPFDATALAETISYFKNIEPKFRSVTCSSTPFIDMYTHRLRDNLLMKKNLSDKDSVWVTIPSIKSDPKHKNENINELEILSYRNWCTRSALDKAEAALEDGNFYIYLERDDNKMWRSMIGMTSYQGKIDQIQGRENNNLIPVSQVHNIRQFIESHRLKCTSAVLDEGPKALQQILIAEKLSEHNEEVGKTLSKALKDKDSFSVLRILGQNVTSAPDGTYEIGTYKPILMLNKQSGITVPYSYASIDEDFLLEKVSKINGDLILYNKNKLYNSSLSNFPPKLHTVTGRVYCTRKQFEKFQPAIIEAVNNDMSRILIY